MEGNRQSASASFFGFIVLLLRFNCVFLRIPTINYNTRVDGDPVSDLRSDKKMIATIVRTVLLEMTFRLNLCTDSRTILWTRSLFINHALYSRSNQHSQVRDLLTTLLVRALRVSYMPNPRNLEAHWKPCIPSISVWLFQMTYDHQNLDCFQEQPVWCTPEGLNLPQNPDKSVTVNLSLSVLTSGLSE